MEVIFKYRDIEIGREQQLLILKNSRIGRVIDLSCHNLRTVSLTDEEGTEFAAPDKVEGDFSFIGLRHLGDESGAWSEPQISCHHHQASWQDGDQVKVSITLQDTVSQILWQRDYLLYPGLPIMATQSSIQSGVTPNILWPRRRELFAETTSELNYPMELAESCVDSFKLARNLQADTTVFFRGRTDYTDDLVRIVPFKKKLACGNLCFCRFKSSETGLFVLQEALPSSERRDWENYDFRLDHRTLFSCNWGVPPEEFQVGETYVSYRHVIGLFHSELERQVVLKTYLRTRFPFDLARHGNVMVNPWGCCCFPQVSSVEFIAKDFVASSAVGATCYQIDDSWQQGRTLAEVTQRNRKMTPEFWQMMPDLEQKLPQIFAAGKKCGVAPALWFAPSCNCDYADWRESAEILLGFYRKYGIKIFKIDAVKLRTYRAERNLRQLLTYVRQKSRGEVSFNLDTTNGLRPGYFHFLEFGNIFLENRYVKHGVCYHPEKILRSLWRLSHYVNTFMLQIEIADVEHLDPEFYARNPVGRPDTYPTDYRAMLAVLASPLLWFTPSTMASSTQQVIKKVMELHRKYRAEIASGITCPIGAEPDGSAITGFHVFNATTHAGFVLIFREKNCTTARTALAVPGLPGQVKFTTLAGQGSVKLLAHEQLEIAVDQQPGYWFGRYEQI